MKCLDCGIKVSDSSTGRCKSCVQFGKRNHNYGKKRPGMNSGKKNGMYGKKGKLNPNWSGDISKEYTTIHYRIYRLFGKADCCENLHCSGNSKSYEWSNKRHDYTSLEREDWQQLCHYCHSQYDLKYNRKNK